VRKGGTKRPRGPAEDLVPRRGVRENRDSRGEKTNSMGKTTEAPPEHAPARPEGCVVPRPRWVAGWPPGARGPVCDRRGEASDRAPALSLAGSSPRGRGLVKDAADLLDRRNSRQRQVRIRDARGIVMARTVASGDETRQPLPNRLRLAGP